MLPPAEFRTLSAHLDDLLRAAGRDPASVRRTQMPTLTSARDRQALEPKLAAALHLDRLEGSLADAIAAVRAQRNNIVGTPELVAAQIAEYAAAGVEELMLQWLDLDDLDGLRAF